MAALAGLVEHEAREVEGAGLAHGEPGAREAVDLRWGRRRAVGREAHEEDAGGLHAHEVADAHRGVRVCDDGEHVGQHAKDVVEEEADDARGDPAQVDAGKRGHKLVKLAREDQVRHVGNDDEGEKHQALAHLAHGLAVGRGVLCGRLGGAGTADLELDLLLGLLGHAASFGSPLCAGRLAFT